MDPSAPPPTEAYLQQTRAPNIIAAGTTLIVIPTIAVLLRLWTHFVTDQGSFWWDDLALALTLIFSNVFLAIDIWWARIGLGRHFEAIPLTALSINNTAEIVGVTFYNVTIACMKISALTLYARLFRISRSFRWQLWIVGIIVTTWGCVSVILPYVNCHPVRKYLDPMIPGTCTNIIHEYEAVAIINFTLDFTVLVMPLPVIWSLQMSLARKLQTTGVMVLGYCSAFLSLARFIIIIRKPGLLSNSSDPDISWNLVPLLYLSMCEAPFGIIALCAPKINHLFRRARIYGVSSLFDSRLYPEASSASHAGPDPGASRVNYTNFDMPQRNRFGDVMNKLGPNTTSQSASAWGSSRARMHPDEELMAGDDIPMDAVLVKKDVLVEGRDR